MTIYGADYYGASTSLYGEGANLPFDASPFTARSWTPGLVELFWSMPTGNWTRLRMVRSNKGFPAYEDDGAIVFDINCGPSSGNFDSGFTYFADVGLTGDRWYQYALFVYSLDDIAWRITDYTDVLVVADHENAEHMQNLLPSVFTTEPAWAGGGQADTTSQMSRFLDIFAFQADTVRTMYESLLHLHNPELVPTRVLSLLCSELGVPFEPQIGYANTRVLLQNAIHIHKTKGTRLGIEAFVSALTGWPCNVSQGYNLMLDYNDSSAEESIGQWAPGLNCTLAQAAATTVGPYQLNGNMANGSFALTSIASGLCEAHCGNNLTKGTIKSGVPINSSTPYTLSMYVQAATTPLVVAVGIYWYDQNGVLLSTSTGTNVASAVSSWTQVPVTATSPAGAQFLAPFINVTATGANQITYYDAVQVEANILANPFQEARQLQIGLGANRVNEVLNPSFESDLSNWVITATSTAAPATSIALVPGDPAPISGFNSAQVNCPGLVPNEGATTVILDLLPNSDYTVSCYVEPISGAGVLLQAQDITNNGPIIESTTAPAGTGWTRLSLTMTTGVNPCNVNLSVVTDSTVSSGSSLAYDAGSYDSGPFDTGSSTYDGGAYDSGVYSGGLVTPPIFRMDGALVERGITLLDYFDGTQSGDNPSDNYWGNTPNDSRSYLYRNYVTKLLRLTELLPDYLWPGMTFAFAIAQDLRGFGRDDFGAGDFGT